MNTGNAIKIFDAGGLKVTRAVPEKHIINFFWPYKLHFNVQYIQMYNKRFDLNSSHHQCKVSNNTFKPKLQQLNLDTVHCTLLHISQNNLP